MTHVSMKMKKAIFENKHAWGRPKGKGDMISTICMLQTLPFVLRLCFSSLGPKEVKENNKCYHSVPRLNQYLSIMCWCSAIASQVMLH